MDTVAKYPPLASSFVMTSVYVEAARFTIPSFGLASRFWMSHCTTCACATEASSELAAVSVAADFMVVLNLRLWADGGTTDTASVVVAARPEVGRDLNKRERFEGIQYPVLVTD